MITKGGMNMRIAFIGGNVIDGTGGRVRENCTIVVDGNKIVSVGPQPEKVSPGKHQVDISGKTLMPGLIDCDRMAHSKGDPTANLVADELRGGNRPAGSEHDQEGRRPDVSTHRGSAGTPRRSEGSDRGHPAQARNGCLPGLPSKR